MNQQPSNSSSVQFNPEEGFGSTLSTAAVPEMTESWYQGDMKQMELGCHQMMVEDVASKELEHKASGGTG